MSILSPSSQLGLNPGKEIMISLIDTQHEEIDICLRDNDVNQRDFININNGYLF